MSILFSSAAINTDGNRIVITLNVDIPPLTTAGGSTSTGFALLADGVSVGLGVWNVSGTTVTIAIPTPIYANQVCTIAYDGTGTITAAPDTLAAFTAQTVTNNSTVGALSSYALTTLANLKLFLHITVTTSDALLTQTINQVSALIETVTGRNFVARDYREHYNGVRQSRLVLNRYPVQHLTRIAYGAGNALHLTFMGSAIRANAATYGPDSLDATGGLRLVTINSSGTKTTSSLSFATYPSVTSLVTAVNLITGWTATTDNNQPSRDLNPIIAGDCLNKTVYITYPDTSDDECTVDAERGLVELPALRQFIPDRWGNCRPEYDWGSRQTGSRFPLGFQNVIVEYNAGYTTVPTDVALVCHEICAEKFYLGEDNPAIKSETTGPYSVTFSYDDSEMIRSRLAHYIDGRALIGG